MKDIYKYIGAGVVSALLLGAGAGMGAWAKDPKIVQVEKQVAVITENIVEVPIEIEVEKIVEVEVENKETIKMMSKFIYDHEGNIEFVTDDLDDDEIMQIADRIVFVNDVKALAVKAIKEEGKEELDDKEVGDIEIDDRDIERFKVIDKDKKVIVEDLDFENKDGIVKVEVQFEIDDVEYGAIFNVLIKDGEVDDIDVDELYLR